MRFIAVLADPHFLGHSAAAEFLFPESFSLSLSARTSYVRVQAPSNNTRGF